MYSLGVVLLELAMWGRIHQIRKLQDLLNAQGTAFDPLKVQDKLTELVDQSLAGVVGRKYANAVFCCLKDSLSGERGESEMRELFYERVLQSLRQISL